MIANASDQTYGEGLSIVIPTYRRVKYLRLLLDGLKEPIQRLGKPVEVILIDDTPSPEQSEIERLAREHTAIYIRGERSVSVKRNQGIRAANYECILLLDSDCRPTPNLLIEHWQSLHSSPDVGGCLGLLTFEGPESWFWDVIELTPFVLPFYWPKYEQTVPWGPTANISFMRHALVNINGFDESFPPQPGGEDVDLGLRIGKAGYRIVTNAKAEVFHTKETWVGVRSMSRRLYSWGRADYELYVRHPERVFRQFPRLLPVAALISSVSVLLALFTRTASLLLAPVLWAALTLLLQGALQDLRFRYGRPRNLLKQIAGIGLTMCDEAGYYSRVLARHDWRALWYKMRYTDGQQIGEWHYGSVRVGSMLLSLFVTTCLVMLLI